MTAARGARAAVKPGVVIVNVIDGDVLNEHIGMYHRS